MENSNTHSNANNPGTVEELLPPGEAGDDTPGERTAAASGPLPVEATADEERKLRAERDALFDRLARQQAEFENFRKRAQKEQAEFRDYVGSDFAKSLLPVLDNFYLALRASTQEKAKIDDLRNGVELIRKQLEEVLLKFGVQPIEAQGKLFDPHQHEAIEMVESADTPENVVLEELQRGYKIKDRLLRPAMVRVARKP